MCRLRVLSVGLNEVTILVRDALLFRAHSKLAVASSLSTLLDNRMTFEMNMSSRVLIWCRLLALALLIFCTQEPL